jgi:hypothetical protein
LAELICVFNFPFHGVNIPFMEYSVKGMNQAIVHHAPCQRLLSARQDTLLAAANSATTALGAAMMPMAQPVSLAT